ncbi:MAG: hypothetical protein VKO64_12475 [Candidatus Sericytochromatia bacterium]|nr:hypothetical protein [Candidatus Sericytochromatia bacterium]
MIRNGDIPNKVKETWMPRTKTKPAAKNAVQTQRKPRRTAYELLQDLEAKRSQLVSQYENKLATLDAKIKSLQTRHQDRIEVARILESMTPEEIAARELEVRAQLSALKKAKRIKNT